MGQSSPPPPPPAPDPTATSDAAVNAQLNALPGTNKVNALAQLGQAGTYTDATGQTHFVDFRGSGEADLAANQQRINAQTADQNAASLLALQKKYGDQLVQQQVHEEQLSDPAQYALRQQYLADTAKQQALGGQLDPTVANEVSQSAIAGQAARGNVLGDANAFQQAMDVGEAAQARQAQRQAVTQSALGLAPVSAQFGNLNQAGQTVPSQPTQYLPVGQVNQQAATDAGLNFAAQNYATGGNIWSTQAQLAAQPSALMQLGMAGLGAGTSLGAAAFKAP